MNLSFARQGSVLGRGVNSQLRPTKIPSAQAMLNYFRGFLPLRSVPLATA